MTFDKPVAIVKILLTRLVSGSVAMYRFVQCTQLHMDIKAQMLFTAVIVPILKCWVV